MSLRSKKTIEFLNSENNASTPKQVRQSRNRHSIAPIDIQKEVAISSTDSENNASTPKPVRQSRSRHSIAPNDMRKGVAISSTDSGNNASTPKLVRQSRSRNSIGSAIDIHREVAKLSMAALKKLSASLNSNDDLDKSNKSDQSITYAVHDLVWYNKKFFIKLFCL